MPITEKGIPSFNHKEDVSPELFQWLQNLQLRLPKTNSYSVTITPALIPAVGNLQTFTVTGLVTTDVLKVSPSALDAGIGIGWARVSAANTMQVSFTNSSGGGITPASGTWYIVATRQ